MSAVFKFRITLFNSFDGECVANFETKPLVVIPGQIQQLEKYLLAYWRRLDRDPDFELGMTISSERMVNISPRTYKVKGRFEEQALPFQVEDLSKIVSDFNSNVR